MNIAVPHAPLRIATATEPPSAAAHFDEIEEILGGARVDLEDGQFGNIAFNMGAASRFAIEGVALLDPEHATLRVAELAGDLGIRITDAARGAAMTDAFVALRSESSRAEGLVQRFTPMVALKLDQVEAALAALRQHVSA